MALKKWIFGTPMGEQLFDQNANIEAIDSAINKISGVGSITWADLAQDVRENITGGNTAVVGVDSVSTVNVVDKAITPEKTSFIVPGKNLFDKRRVQLNKFVNGVYIQDNAGFFASHDIFATKEMDVTISHCRTYTVYDANGTYKTTFNTQNNAASTTLHLLQGEYFRFSTAPQYLDVVMVNEGSSAVPFEDYYMRMEGVEVGVDSVSTVNVVDKAITPEKTSFIELGKNLFDKRRAQLNKFVNGVYVQDNAGFFASHDIFAPKEMDVTISHCRTYTIYDSAGVYKSTINTQSNTATTTLHLLAGEYFRFSTAPQYLDLVMVNEGKIILPYEQYYMKINGVEIDTPSESTDKLKGKKWVTFGDSFTYAGYTPMNTFSEGLSKGFNKTYPYYIRNRTGIDVLMYARGGRTIAYPPDGSFTNSITCPTNEHFYQKIPVDVDYITIYLGINDSHLEGEAGTVGKIPLGTITDSDTSTYYGAYNVVLKWLIENRPFAHIGIIVSNGCDREAYRVAQLDIAKKYGLQYIDLNGDQVSPTMIRSQNPDIDPNIKRLILEKQAVDPYGNITGKVNTHPNDAAHEYESYAIENFLRRL